MILLFLFATDLFGKDVMKYQFRHMNLESRDFFLQSNPKGEPGKLCGQFRNMHSCAILVYDPNSKGAISLDMKMKGKWINLYKLLPPSDFVYLTKGYPKQGEESIQLHYYGKSTIEFRFVNGKKTTKWIND